MLPTSTLTVKIYLIFYLTPNICPIINWYILVTKPNLFINLQVYVHYRIAALICTVTYMKLFLSLVFLFQ